MFLNWYWKKGHKTRIRMSYLHNVQLHILVFHSPAGRNHTYNDSWQITLLQDICFIQHHYATIIGLSVLLFLRALYSIECDNSIFWWPFLYIRLQLLLLFVAVLEKKKKNVKTLGNNSLWHARWYHTRIFQHHMSNYCFLRIV